MYLDGQTGVGVRGIEGERDGRDQRDEGNITNTNVILNNRISFNF